MLTDKQIEIALEQLIHDIIEDAGMIDEDTLTARVAAAVNTNGNLRDAIFHQQLRREIARSQSRYDQRQAAERDAKEQQ